LSQFYDFGPASQILRGIRTSSKSHGHEPQQGRTSTLGGGTSTLLMLAFTSLVAS